MSLIGLVPDQRRVCELIFVWAASKWR